MSSLKLVCAFGAAVTLLGAAGQAKAEAPTIQIEHEVSMGTFGSHEYVYVEGLLKGTVRGDASYEVPFQLAYPTDGGNKTGFVDLAETSWFLLWLDAQGAPVVCGRGDFRDRDPLVNGDTLCDEGENEGSRIEDVIIPGALRTQQGYLFREGYTYMSIQWWKFVTDYMGPTPPDGNRRYLAYGSIEEGLDGAEIIRDAGRWLRGPSEDAVGAVDYNILHGFSAAGGRVASFVYEGSNIDTDDSLIYDGFMATRNGALTLFQSNDPPYGLPDFPQGVPDPGDAKFLQIDTESDFAGSFADLARDPNIGEAEEIQNHMRWEVTGVAHLSSAVDDLSYMGATRQNPVDWNPVERAGVTRLREWIVDGTKPNRPSLIPGFSVEVAPETFIYFPEVDEDGNASLGGIRLPHVRRDENTGAPTGVYAGYEFGTMDEPVGNLYVGLGGTYERFSDEKLMELYPTEEDYRAKYKAAADAVLAEGFILQEDYDKMVAARPDIPQPPEFADAGSGELRRTEEGSCSCSSGTGGKLPLSTILFMGVALFVIRRRKGRVQVGRISSLLALLVGGTALNSGCDGDTTTVECISHQCPDQERIMALPEGGEIRLELVHRPGNVPEVRTHAWFASDQNPAQRPFTLDPAEWDIPYNPNLCVDMTTGSYFPAGPVMSRTYLDVGPDVTFDNGEHQITLPGVPNAQDNAGYALFHDLLYIDDVDPGQLDPGTEWDFSIAGNADVEATTFEDALRLPPRANITFPGSLNPAKLSRDEDFVITWEQPGDVEPFDYAFLAFEDPYGPLGFCIGPQNGYMSVPREFLDTIPSGGFFLFGTLNHRAVDFNGRRLDFVGINCEESTYYTDDEL